MPTLKFRDPNTGQMVPLLGGISQSSADARYINLSGDTFTGNVTTSTPPATANDVVTKSFVDSLVPPGMIASTLSATAPAGWLLCDGAAYNTTTYADLYAVIGATFGGYTPNLKGRCVVGTYSSDGRYTHAAANSMATMNHTLSAAECANASGYINFHGGGSRTSFYYIDSGNAFQQNGYIGAYANPQYPQSPYYSHGGWSFNYGGGGGAHSNLQPYTVVNFVIKV